MSQKVAKLVLVSLLTRVVVDENATSEQILEVARPSLLEKINSELSENLEDIIDDKEMPYGTLPDEKNNN